MIEKIQFQNLWGAVKAVLREKCISLYVHSRQKFETNYLSSYLEKIQEEKQSKPKVIRGIF